MTTCHTWGGPLLILIPRHHKATCQRHSHPLRATQRCWLLCPRPRLLVYSGHGCWWGGGAWGWRGIIWIPLEWSCGGGVQVLFHRPLSPPPKLTQTHSVSGWWAEARLPDTQAAHCLPAWPRRAGLCWYSWGRQRCREVKWLDRGQSTSLSHTHTHTHTHKHTRMIMCARTHNDTQYVSIVFLCRHRFKLRPGQMYCPQQFNVVQECVYVTLSDCPLFLPLWIMPNFQHGHTFKSTSGRTSLVSLVDLIFVRARSSSGRQIDHKGSQYPSDCWDFFFFLFWFNCPPVGGALNSESQPYPH